MRYGFLFALGLNLAESQPRVSHPADNKKARLREPSCLRSNSSLELFGCCAWNLRLKPNAEKCANPHLWAQTFAGLPRLTMVPTATLTMRRWRAGENETGNCYTLAAAL